MLVLPTLDFLTLEKNHGVNRTSELSEVQARNVVVQAFHQDLLHTPLLLAILESKDLGQSLGVGIDVPTIGGFVDHITKPNIWAWD